MSAYTDRYKEKSIWGEDGPPWAEETGIKEAAKNKGKDMDMGIHTDAFKKGYEKGIEKYKTDVFHKALTTKDEQARKDMQDLLKRAENARDEGRISKGGIILP